MRLTPIGMLATVGPTVAALDDVDDNDDDDDDDDDTNSYLCSIERAVQIPYDRPAIWFISA
jgi:hypothetical protein